MATVVGKKKRLQMTLKAFKNGKVVQSTSYYVLTRIRATIQVSLTAECDFYRLRVTYNNKDDYWNEFDFTDKATALRELSTITETELVKYFM